METLAAAIKRREYKQWTLWWVLPLVVLGGWFYPKLGYLLLVCMMAGMGIALYKGRSWCDWMCPRGASWDLLLSKISRQRKIPAFFRHPAFRVVILAVMMTVIFTQIPRAWPSIDGMGRVFVMMLTVTTVVGLVLGIPTHHRNWCTYCPVGTMGNWLGKGKYPLTINAQCNQCKTCDEVCSMQIYRWQYRPEQGQRVVPEWDCLKCGLCVEACPKGALGFEKSS